MLAIGSSRHLTVRKEDREGKEDRGDPNSMALQRHVDLFYAVLAEWATKVGCRGTFAAVVDFAAPARIGYKTTYAMHAPRGRLVQNRLTFVTPFEKPQPALSPPLAMFE